MSTFKTYGVTREFGCTVYSNSGFDSHEEALLNVHKRAFKNGDWEPRELREKWWQFWRPTEHDEIELHFVNPTQEPTDDQ